MKVRKILIILSLVIFNIAFAQSTPLEKARAKGWEFEIRGGVNIGGAVPVPMLNEIRSINSYSPTFNGLIEAHVTKWFEPQGNLGLMMGVGFEEKGMKTSARVKGYMTTIEYSGELVTGMWSGDVFTSYSSTYMVFPLQMVYKIHKDGKINGGVYIAARLDGDFSGYVSDGYFRKGSPIGEKMVFGKDNKASFDFKDDLASVETGMQIGGSWKAYKHFLVFADIKYSFTNIFKSRSYIADNHLHPLYMSVGFSYLF